MKTRSKPIRLYNLDRTGKHHESANRSLDLTVPSFDSMPSLPQACRRRSNTSYNRYSSLLFRLYFLLLRYLMAPGITKTTPQSITAAVDILFLQFCLKVRYDIAMLSAL
jgi:hypothetical protein